MSKSPNCPAVWSVWSSSTMSYVHEFYRSRYIIGPLRYLFGLHGNKAHPSVLLICLHCKFSVWSCLSAYIEHNNNNNVDKWLYNIGCIFVPNSYETSGDTSSWQATLRFVYTLMNKFSSDHWFVLCVRSTATGQRSCLMAAWKENNKSSLCTVCCV